MRSDYAGSGSVPENRTPWRLLEDWISAAHDAGSEEPEAMCLATSGPEGPSARFLLLRGLDAAGLRFYTNYESRKGRDLESEARCEACFWWPETQRQVRVAGRASRLSAETSDSYFLSRPMGSRWSAAASRQSREIESRHVLLEEVARLQREFPQGPPRPAGWGGYLLAPERWEFWIGRPGRLHERHVFVKAGSAWRRTLLAP